MLIEWFDIAWFWLGRIVGGAFIVGFALAIFLTILEYVWGLVGTAWKLTKRIIQETKLFVEFLKWKRDSK